VNSRTPITLLEVRPQKKATNAGVRQDKYPPRRIDVFSDQPQSAAAPPESAKTAPPPANPPADNRPKHHGSETRQTAQIWGRAPIATKVKIQAMAKAQGLSESEVVVSLVHKGMQIDGDVQYGAMLRPVIQDQIHKDIQNYSNRTSSISFQALYAAEQSRLLSINILRFLTDLMEVDAEFLPTIAACQQNAWDTITKMTSDMPPVPPPRKETNREWQS
jgi:hypothetical protein